MNVRINEQTGKIKSRKTASKIIKILAVLSLAGACISGMVNNDKHLNTDLLKLYPQSKIEKVSSHPLIYKYENVTQNINGHIAVNREQGWGGPLHTATDIDGEGNIKKVHVLKHRETPSFYTKLISNKFFEQFIGEKANSSFIVGEDIDAVTRATISSKGFTRAIRTGSHDAAREVHDLTVKERELRWKFGTNELILIILYSLVAIGSIRKIPKLRYFTMAAGLAFLGFYPSFPLSISYIASIFLGYFPIPQEHMFWWLLTGGIFLMIAIHGKNLYCSWLCPFGALQEFLGRISGIRIKLHPGVVKFERHLRSFLTWLSLMIIFISRNPALGNYEPFAAIFSFEGTGIVWYVLPVILFSSFFIRRFWCRFLCPAGMALDTGCRARNKIIKIFRKKINQ